MSRRILPANLLGRTAVLMPITMALWWFLFKGISLRLLQALAYVPLALLIAPPGMTPVRTNPATGEWVFNVAVNQYATDPQTGQRQLVDSLEFAAEEQGIVGFASGWFAYLALAFSATSFSRAQAKRVLLGLGIQTVTGILSVVLFAYIRGYAPVGATLNDTRPFVWLSKYVYYLINLVVPFAGPFLIALAVHPEWRECFTPHSSRSVKAGSTLMARRAGK